MIVRRYEPVEFDVLMRKLSPIYSTWLMGSEPKKEERISEYGV